MSRRPCRGNRVSTPVLAGVAPGLLPDRPAVG